MLKITLKLVTLILKCRTFLVKNLAYNKNAKRKPKSSSLNLGPLKLTGLGAYKEPFKLFQNGFVFTRSKFNKTIKLEGHTNSTCFISV